MKVHLKDNLRTLMSCSIEIFAFLSNLAKRKLIFSKTELNSRCSKVMFCNGKTQEEMGW